MAEEAKAAIVVAQEQVRALAEVAPAGGLVGKLSEVASVGLDRLAEIVSMPLDQADVKQMRLIGDMALGACKLLQRASEASLQAQQQDRIGEILERLANAGKEPIDA